MISRSIAAVVVALMVLVAQGTIIAQRAPASRIAPPRELKAASPSKLFYDDDSDRQIEFVFGNDGVKMVRFVSQGLVTELKKVK